MKSVTAGGPEPAVTLRCDRRAYASAGRARAPSTAGDAMKPSSRKFSASTLNSRPAVEHSGLAILVEDVDAATSDDRRRRVGPLDRARARRISPVFASTRADDAAVVDHEDHVADQQNRRFARRPLARSATRRATPATSPLPSGRMARSCAASKPIGTKTRPWPATGRVLPEWLPRSTTPPDLLAGLRVVGVQAPFEPEAHHDRAPVDRRRSAASRTPCGSRRRPSACRRDSDPGNRPTARVRHTVLPVCLSSATTN